MSSNSVCNHTRDKQIGLPLRGRPILLSLVWLQTELDSTQSYYHYYLYIKSVSEKKSRGHRTSKIVKSKAKLQQWPSALLLFSLVLSARARCMTCMWICVRSKDAQKMLCPRGGGVTTGGGDFDQEQKFRVKLPNPWIDFSSKFPTLGKALSST